MSDSLDFLKNRTTLLVIGGLLLLIIIWLVAFFLPQGSKLSKLSAQEQTLQAQVTAGNAKVAALKKEALNTPELEAISQQLTTYVPPNAGVYTYITTMSNTATAANVSIVSLLPGSPVATAGSEFASIPFTVAVKGTYDELLTFIQDVYALPRLTTINSIAITGGGPQTNRSTELAMTADLTIFTSAKSPTP
jgi:type IV pilus assembly protein PilO